MTIEEKAMPTRTLLGSSDPARQAELQWRLSLVVLIPILMVLVVPLSRVSPREGRFARMVPAMVLYILYFGLLLAGRDMVAGGSLSPVVGIWSVHLLFLILAILLFTERMPQWRGWRR